MGYKNKVTGLHRVSIDLRANFACNFTPMNFIILIAINLRDFINTSNNLNPCSVCSLMGEPVS